MPLTGLTELQALASRAIDNGDIFQFGQLMLWELDQHRRNVGEDQWRSHDIPILRKSPFYPLALDCPFSRRATDKPRGYPGDAELIDFLYRSDNVAEQVCRSTPVGQAIHNFWVNSPAARAVRNRKDFFTQEILRTITNNANARILVLACGHFREVDTILGTVSNSGAKITCLDQDAESCSVVRQLPSGECITVINANVTGVRHLTGDRFDLIYAAGLYDYLNDRIAIKLNKMLVPLLAEKGKLIVPNFLDSAPNRASMELLQDWFLIYRDKQQILRLIDESAPTNGDNVAYYEDDYRSIGWAVYENR